ncbi:PIN domain-containing protein [soil metagenome]
MIVLDASAAVSVLLNVDRVARDLRYRIQQPDESLHVPHLFDVEVLHVLRRHSFSGALSERRERVALDRLSSTRMTRYPHTALLGRIWELKNNLTAYDAAYVALAESLAAPLVTLDGRLSQAPGLRAPVEVYG